MKLSRNSSSRCVWSSATLSASAVLFVGCSGSVDNSGMGDGPAMGEPGISMDPGAEMLTGTPGAGMDPGTGIAPGASTDPAASGAPPTDPGALPGTPADPGAPANPGAAGPSQCAPGVPQTSQLPRLTRVQYDNTIRELLGIDSQPSTMLAPDTPGSVDQRAWDGYQTAAAALATQVMADATARAKVIPCTPSGDGAACASQLVAEFGARAFRRPLTPEEIARFEALFTSRAEYTASGTFDEAAQLIIEAFLVSPSFLTRAEISEVAEGEYLALNDYEVASRLSYMLWGNMPDEALFAAAAAGTLSTPAEIGAQAQRMLLDDKARGQVANFHQQYAHMGSGTRWAEISRDETLFPEFSETLVPLLSSETELLFEHIVFELGGTFQDLITSPTAFVNADTAPLYGLEAAAYGAELVPVDLDPAKRPGIFTRLGFLTSHSGFDRTSPILRGAFLQKEVLCTEVPPPPPGVEGTPLPTEGLTTNRERVDAQTAAADCVTCHHTVINPTGFALEAYDAIGRLQSMDNGAPVDTTATVPMDSVGVAVTGPADLMTAIANSRQAQHCYAQKWVQYAYEREPNPQDACVVESMAGKLTVGDYSVLSLVADLTQSDSFRYRAIETEVAQ
jgi:hypothetical protein